MNRSILANKQRLDNLYQKVSQIAIQDQSEWSKYLCVLTAGFIEESLRILLIEFTKNNSSLEIQRFMQREISFITNCKTERILEVLNKFDTNWSTAFETEIKAKSKIDNEIKDSIDSIVRNRHLIAHGKSVGLSFSTINNYYVFCLKAIQILENIVI